MRIRRRKLEAEHHEPSGRVSDLEDQTAGQRPPLASAIDDALSSLPDTQRVPFVLRHIDGLSYDEIADFMDTEPSTIRGRIHTAKKRLQEDMTNMAAKQIRKQRLSSGFTKAVTKSLFWHEQPIRIAEKLSPDDVCFLYLDLRNGPTVAIQGTSGKYPRVTGRTVLFGKSADEAQSRAAQVKVEVARKTDVYATGPTHAKVFHGVKLTSTTTTKGGRKRHTSHAAEPIHTTTTAQWAALRDELARFPATSDALRRALSGKVVEMTACTDTIETMWASSSLLKKTGGFAGVGGGDRAGRLLAATGGAELTIRLPKCRLLVVVLQGKSTLRLSGLRNSALVVGDGYESVLAEGVRGDLHVFNCIPEQLSNVQGDLRLHVPFYGGGGRFSPGRAERMGWKKQAVSIRGVEGSLWARVRALDLDITCESQATDVERAFGDIRATLPDVSSASRHRFHSISGSVDLRLACPWPDNWNVALWTEAGAVDVRPARWASGSRRFERGIGCPECVHKGTTLWSERETCDLQASSSLGDVRFTYRRPKAK